MKKLLLLFLPMFFSCQLFAQVEPANYKAGVLEFQKLYNNNDADNLYNMFDAKMQTAITPDKTKQLINQLKTQLGSLNTTEFKSLNVPLALYKASFTNGIFALRIGFDSNNKINGLFFGAYQDDKAVKVDAALTESPVNLILPDTRLAGSIITPKNTTGKIPVVLIIAGSGSTNRDGNGSGILPYSYLLLANALGKNNIATLRYDKKFSGETQTKKTEADLRFDDYVNDAIGLIKQFKTDSRFSKIIVLGHSEGSLVGMIAAEREKVDAYISLAGAGEEINKTLAVQTKSQSPENYKVTLGRLDSLSKGLTVKAAVTDQLFRPSIQPYLISWMKYNPQTEIRKLKIPVLIVQGTTDIQVSVNNAQNLEKAKPDAKLVLIDGMNHILKDAPADRTQNIATYKQPELPIDTKLVDAVTQFVNQLK